MNSDLLLHSNYSNYIPKPGALPPVRKCYQKHNFRNAVQSGSCDNFKLLLYYTPKGEGTRLTFHVLFKTQNEATVIMEYYII